MKLQTVFAGSKFEKQEIGRIMYCMFAYWRVHRGDELTEEYLYLEDRLTKHIGLDKMLRRYLTKAMCKIDVPKVMNNCKLAYTWVHSPCLHWPMIK